MSLAQSFSFSRAGRYLIPSTALVFLSNVVMVWALAVQQLLAFWVCILKLKWLMISKAFFSKSVFFKLDYAFSHYFKFSVGLRFWMRVWEGNKFFFFSVSFKLQLKNNPHGQNLKDLFYDVVKKDGTYIISLTFWIMLRVAVFSYSVYRCYARPGV